MPKRRMMHRPADICIGTTTLVLSSLVSLSLSFSADSRKRYMTLSRTTRALSPLPPPPRALSRELETARRIDKRNYKARWLIFVAWPAIIVDLYIRLSGFINHDEHISER